MRPYFRNAKLPAMTIATPMTRLERWVAENDVTYDQLAKQVGVTTPALYHYVRGRNKPSAQNLVKLSQITGIPCEELMEQPAERLNS